MNQEKEKNMIKINETKHEKIHTRQITVTTYDTSEGMIIVEGVLKDDRLLEVYRPAGETIPPGTVHHMVIRLLLGGPMPLAVHDAEAEMPRVPRELCHRTLESIKGIIGLKIQSGFGAIKNFYGKC